MRKVLAFDIGGTNTRLVLINEKFKIEKELVTSTPFGSIDAFIQNIFDMLDQFPLENVEAISAALPGVVDDEKGIIVTLPNVGIHNINLREILEAKYHIPVHLINDAFAGCLGEAYLGAGKKFNRVFFITISTGLGGSLCVDKKVQYYVNEVGHTLFKYKDGYQEYEVASGCHIEVLSKLNGLDYKDMKTFFNDVKLRKPEALKLYEEWLSIINKFITLVEDSYLPEIIVMTGGVMKSRDVFWDDLLKAHPNTKIQLCEFKDRAGMMGSGVFAMQCAKII